MSALTAIPLCLVAAGILLPFVALDAGTDYFAFLAANPRLVAAIALFWGVLFHWTTRRLAEVLLLRSSGAKLRVGDGA